MAHALSVALALVSVKAMEVGGLHLASCSTEKLVSLAGVVPSFRTGR